MPGPPNPTQPQLAPPGAGVPWYELAWVRPTFRITAVLLSDAAATRRFRREGEHMLARVVALPTEQALVRVLIDRVVGIEDSSRYWSACMVLEHLRIVDEMIADITEMLGQGSAYPRRIGTADVKPSPSVGADVIGQFEATMTAYMVRVPAALATRSSARHAHPWFGPLTAHEWHCLAAIHHTLHRRQLIRILKGLPGGGPH